VRRGLAAGLLLLGLGCGDETTGAITGAPRSCSSASECAADEACDFPDDLCGSGEKGACVKRPDVCSDGTPVCGCDGAAHESSGCAALAGSDLSMGGGGGCSTPAGKFPCGPLFCPTFGGYCERTAFEDVSCVGAETYGCAFFDPNCAPQDCSCLPGLACEVDAGGNPTATKTSPGCPP
jgi:hypothetical protein